MARKALLVCGIVSSLLYVAMNIFVAMQWQGYSSMSQTVSELSAIGAPTRALWVLLGTAWSVLVIAFGLGVWKSADGSRLLRVVGALLIAHAAFGLVWPPMHQREVLAAGGGTLTDTLHIVWTVVAGVFMLLEIGLAAAAFGRRFRLYSIATAIAIVGFGVVTGFDAPRMQANLPTPWMGMWERIGIAALILWMMVLAIALLRVKKPTVLPGSIAEIGYLRLGGLDQWVMIRGESVSNPVLILLHGGPGFSDTRFFRHFNSCLEKTFTIVYWDQRGTGKSFDPGISRSSMTVEQFITDLDELVEAVRTRLGKSTVTILGHSWGSLLGVLYAARFPEKVAAYVGCAQIGDCAATEASSYAFALAEAERLGNRKALEALHAIGPPPYPASSVFTERIWLQRMEGQLNPRALWKMARVALGGTESSILDLPDVVRGFRFSMDAMWAEVSALNLTRQVPALQMPVFFFVGGRDHWVPAETSVAYFDVLAAPLKKIVWFEESGHEPFMDEPARFNRTMVDLVRPVLDLSAVNVRVTGREAREGLSATA